MSSEKILMARSNNCCELCKSQSGLSVYEVPPASLNNADNTIYICEKCKAQLDKKKN
jgi:protein PhnA